MATATTRLIDLVRAANGDCSDYRVGKLMGVGTSAVSKWRTENGHMNADNVAKACELAGIPHRAYYWVNRVAVDRETGEAQRQAQDVVADLERMEKGLQPRKGGIVDMLIHWGQHAAITLIAVAIGASAFAPTKQAISAPMVDSGSFAKNVYYVTLWMRAWRRRIARWFTDRRRRRWHGLPMNGVAKGFTWFPIAVLCAGCSALQLPEERAWQALHLVDAIQTADASHDPCFEEGTALTRELIGANPSDAEVIAWSVGLAAAHAGITQLLIEHEHPRLAKAWSYLTLGEKAYAVGRNYHLGIRLGGTNKTPAGCVR